MEIQHTLTAGGSHRPNSETWLHTWNGLVQACQELRIWGMPITVLSALGTYCNMHSKPMGDASVPENSTVPVGTKDTLRGDPSTETTGAWVSMENSWVATSVSSLPLTANWYWPSGKPLQSHAWVTAALRVCVPFPVQRQLIYKTSISSHFGQATPVFVRRFT